MRSFIQIYALAVCFSTLMCFVVAAGIAVYDIVEASAPDFTLDWAQVYRSNESFAQYYPQQTDLSTIEITAIREQALQDALHAERRNAFQSMLFISIVLVIDIVVFAVHWRIARQEHRLPIADAITAGL